MSKQSAIRSVTSDYLSVIHKAPGANKIAADHHAVLQTDLQLNITGWNKLAEELIGRAGMTGKNLFSIFDIEFINGHRDELLMSVREMGFWCGDVCYRRYDGQKYNLRITAASIINENAEPVSIMIAALIGSDTKHREEKLAAAEIEFETLVNTLPDGFLIIGKDGKIISGNKRAASILGIAEDEMPGMLAASPSWNAIKADGTAFPVHQFPCSVSLQTGFPQRNVVMGIEQPGGNRVWLSINSEALIKPGEFDPYAAVMSFSDITNYITTQKELLKSNERFHHVARVSSDAFWDFDLVTNDIYRSETFCRLSGYSPDQISSSLNWWFDKIHPDDQERVKRKLDEQLWAKNERWEDEYRFGYADGTFKDLHDSGIILYKDGKPVRIIGAIRDITDEKKLKRQLTEEQAQKQKAITLATLQAQEQEKTKISRELHDNVNQILMSAKLYMETAKQTPENSTVLLDKAVEYQLLALHEIRKLSRSLNTSAIASAGLSESIRDIVNNLEALQQMQVNFSFEKLLEQKLNSDEKLTVYRVIQEQTNNIIKYAAASKVKIEVKETNGRLLLRITDNGKGFDPAAVQNNKGIGLVNMSSRAAAHGGTLSVISSPGNGCRLEMNFPVA